MGKNYKMVILVDIDDNQIGKMEKMKAHEKALLHRAFSVFIFNSKKEILMQQRALSKYHSAGLWTNTCCSHPVPNENTLHAANRRLMEEMGMKADLEYLFKFKYKAPFDNNLTEHEIDHVFIGYSDELPKINTEEVNEYKYMTTKQIKNDLKSNPNNYTEWFKIIFDRFCKEYDFCE